MIRKLKNRKSRQDRISFPLIAHTHPKLAITEQYRLVRTNILFASVDKEIQTIMVTSAEPSDGKTTTASNLAIVLAQQEKKVLLVDADLRKPSVHYAFKANNIEGLTSVLAKKVNLEDAIINTHIPDLDILTSGPIPPNPSELLDSKSMETIIEELKDRYDYVVFDTPPVIAVTDPQILANRCDGVVMVVASEKTQRDRALKAKELLQKANSYLLGVVVNGVEVTKDSYYGKYGS